MGQAKIYSKTVHVNSIHSAKILALTVDEIVGKVCNLLLSAEQRFALQNPYR